MSEFASPSRLAEDCGFSHLTKLDSQRLIDFFLKPGAPDDIGEQISGVLPLGVNNISTGLFTIIDKKDMMRRINRGIMPMFRA